MKQNKLYTPSYFKKRLVDEFGKNKNISIEKLNYEFPKEDYRKWIIKIEIKNEDDNRLKDVIFFTCYKISKEDYWFFANCKNHFNYNIKTESMNVIFSFIKQSI